MDIKIKGDLFVVKRRLKRNETYKISKTKKFETITFLKKPQLVQGISSATQDNMDVLFIDYDNIERSVVLRDFMFIQELYDLPQAYLLTTSEKNSIGEKIGNYHVICLKKFLPAEIYEILQYTHCDSAYMDMPLRNKYRNWILRISNKRDKSRPKFISLIGKPINNDSEVSKPHKDFLSKIYRTIKHPTYKRVDKSNVAYLQTYEAS